MGCAITNAGATPVSVAMIRMQSDGIANIAAGSTEMGQGVRTTLTQIAAEELTLPMEQFRMLGADTKVTPYDSSTGSSRSTTLMGTAVQKAARDLRQQFIKIGAQTMGVKPNQIHVVDGALVCGESRLSFKEAFERRFGKGSGGEMIGRGEAGPEITDNKLPVFWEVGMGSAEVDIDRETGEVKLKKFISVADVGKAIHPEHCVAQEEGAAMQGIGHTFFEQLIYDNGQLINPNLVDYRIPTFNEVPEEFHTVLVENGDGPGPVRRARHGRRRDSLRRAVGVQRHRPRHRSAHSRPTVDPGAGLARAEGSRQISKTIFATKTRMTRRFRIP